MIKTDLKPVTDVKRRATAIIRKLQKDRVPVLITERGRSAAVLVDARTWEDVQNRLEVLEGIARGERAFQEGRVVSHADARRRMARYLARPKAKARAEAKAKPRARATD